MAEVYNAENTVFGLDIGTRSIVGTVGYKKNERDFVVIAQHVRFHETRAIMDGQVHDIEKVAGSIQEVRRELEQQTGYKLTDVCIAAAGRVLKTLEVHTELELEENTIITEEHIRTLVAGGIEKAYREIRESNKQSGLNFHCVGHTVIHYFLNDYLMSSLEAHRGSKIAADILATFLPQEVVDGLTSSVERAGLNVVNMTLEPIAAMQVAIPENYRLLNIALVDVGAGTSDISITKDGSIVAYGMIPYAGDAITEVIMHKHLVDFTTAESIKLASTKKKQVSFKDIMKMKQKVESEDIKAEVRDAINSMADKIGEKIISLNGGKAVSAVFVVGGGGKYPGFTEALAKRLKLPQERVALRGEEVLGSVQFLQENIKKDSTLVTPVGICLNYYEQKNNLIFVYVNEERIKLYDNSNLTISDAALEYGYPNEKLFPQRGEALNFTVNGERRFIRGGLGEAAVIKLNGEIAAINTPISQADVIEITESTVGVSASCNIKSLEEYKKETLNFVVNGKTVVCPRIIKVNGEDIATDYEIQDGDAIELPEYYTAAQLLNYMDLETEGEVWVNRAVAAPEDKIYEHFVIEVKLVSSYEYNKQGKFQEQIVQEEPVYEETVQTENAVIRQESKPVVQQTVMQQAAVQPQEQTVVPAAFDMVVLVNGTPVVMKNKSIYYLVDVLDYYPFDLKQPHGTAVVIRVNGEDSIFTRQLFDGDKIELYWTN